jgi:hypothetical protein
MAGRQGRRRFGAIRRLPSGRYQVRYRTSDDRYVSAPTTRVPQLVSTRSSELGR